MEEKAEKRSRRRREKGREKQHAYEDGGIISVK
jgi:hypothetical protein